MANKFRRLCAIALLGAFQIGLAGLALAQISPAPAPGGGGPAAYPADALVEAAPPTETTPGTQLPVLYVTSVEVVRTSAEPKLDIVRVTGLASSQGWSEPQLVPTFAGKPLDDILDLQFIATEPDQSQNADGFVPIGAIFPLEPGDPFKGVRVRASETQSRLHRSQVSTRRRSPSTTAVTASARNLSSAVRRNPDNRE